MFGDLRRFDNDPLHHADWFRQWLEGLFSENGAADIRSVPRGSFPIINIGRTDDAIRVYVFAPGLTADDLEVSLQDNVLTLRGKREGPDRQDASGNTRPRFRRERFSGEFARSIALPDGLDAERADARFHDGVFEIHLPKREELKPRRIEIQAA
ncbi:Hsp20/alpha crystallin family protein [Litchfieldella xinjiangensis]|uniref:Hsp20/alpha crystallin family protein n=1 Tax=Litchfieldella xinjiangensis TaxID=1166948 RepID=UPI0005B991AD|nr:Hsp20/alpha crystallin family protein [Halomonas xinjiangensis]